MSALKNAIQDILLKDHRAIENAFTKYVYYCKYQYKYSDLTLWLDCLVPPSLPSASN